MRKLFPFFAAALLVACSNTVSPTPGSEDIVRLNSEPEGCRFLYKLDTESAVYKSEDAEIYLKNRIASQPIPGNSFWLISERSRENPSAVFGPKNTFLITANVYECE